MQWKLLLHEWWTVQQSFLFISFTFQFLSQYLTRYFNSKDGCYKQNGWAKYEIGNLNRKTHSGQASIVIFKKGGFHYILYLGIFLKVKPNLRSNIRFGNIKGGSAKMWFLIFFVCFVIPQYLSNNLLYSCATLLYYFALCRVGHKYFAKIGEFGLSLYN